MSDRVFWSIENRVFPRKILRLVTLSQLLVWGTRTWLIWLFRFGFWIRILRMLRARHLILDYFLWATRFHIWFKMYMVVVVFRSLFIFLGDIFVSSWFQFLIVCIYVQHFKGFWSISTKGLWIKGLVRLSIVIHRSHVYISLLYDWRCARIWRLINVNSLLRFW